MRLAKSRAAGASGIGNSGSGLVFASPCISRRWIPKAVTKVIQSRISEELLALRRHCLRSPSRARSGFPRIETGISRLVPDFTVPCLRSYMPLPFMNRKIMLMKHVAARPEYERSVSLLSGVRGEAAEPRSCQITERFALKADPLATCQLTTAISSSAFRGREASCITVTSSFSCWKILFKASGKSCGTIGFLRESLGKRGAVG